MIARAYYNEIEPYAAEWLRNLIAAGLIAPGDVDERSIVDVRPDDLRGYAQCHFFAGVGVWSYALRRAGWPDDRPVWTGSCPCQPFSSAGKGGGFDDERHLWPAMHHLISQCRPDVVFGEQVASKDGLAWLDLVQADLEGSGYAGGAVDLCAAGVGAPHIRQRLWWVAERLEHASRDGRQQWRAEPSGWRSAGGCGAIGLANVHGDGCQPGREGFSPLGHGPAAQSDRSVVGLEHGEREGLEGQRGRPAAESGRDGTLRSVAATGEPLRLANDTGSERARQMCEQGGEPGSGSAGVPAGGCGDAGGAGPTNGLWRDADWLHCRDGKWRPVEPSTFPLAHGAPARVGRLRAYGNAIVAEAAAQFIGAYLGATEATTLLEAAE
ncbi:DNA cytosine methyltransferase [Xanthobacteraceae bacterium A53D]